MVGVADDEDLARSQRAACVLGVLLGRLALLLDEDRLARHPERFGHLGCHAGLGDGLVLAAATGHHDPWGSPLLEELHGVSHATAHREAGRPVARNTAAQHDDRIPGRPLRA